MSVVLDLPVPDTCVNESVLSARVQPNESNASIKVEFALFLLVIHAV